MTYLSDAALRAGVWLTTNTTPSPSPTFGSYTGDEDLITPGWIGFAITFVIMAPHALPRRDPHAARGRGRRRGFVRQTGINSATQRLHLSHGVTRLCAPARVTRK
jgi:hypothetical protein